MAERNIKKTPYEEHQEKIKKKIMGYKLGDEASVIAMMYKNPDLLKESNLTDSDFHGVGWKTYFKILKGLIINEKKMCATDIDVGLYLKKHPEQKKEYEKYGGYNTIETALEKYVSEPNFDSYLENLRKWNAILKLIDRGFPCDEKRLSRICDMTIDELYEEYTVYLNDTFANVENNVQTYNGFDGMKELIDELDSGSAIGIPFANCDILNREVGGMLGGNIIGLGAASGCVDCDTEFFTGTGWKRISDYQDGDMVLQYNKDGTAELVRPLAYIKNKAEYLWHFKTKYGLDQCLSDEHTVVYKSDTTGSGNEGHMNKIKFKKLRERHEKNVYGFTGRFYTSFNYGGNGIDLTDDEIRLMVATFADGSFFKKYENCPETKIYTQSRFHIKKDRKKERLVYLAQQTGREYSVRDNAMEGYDDIYIDVPFRAKHFPMEWYNCSKHQLQVIADEVMFWDGNASENNRYSTSCKDDADFIQFVYSSLGYRASIITNNRSGQKYKTCGKVYTRKSIEYSVNYTTRNLVGMTNGKNKTKITKYKTLDGYEYCFTVPSHMLVLRRNNKIFITGNCGKSTLSINYVFPSMIKNDLRAVFIINEEDQNKFKKEALVWYCTNVLKKPIQKRILRDGNFDDETKETLYKAAEWFENQKDNHTITIVPLERYTAKTVVKLLKKWSHMADVIVLDTLKESADSRDKESWKSMMTDCVDFYDCIKHTDACMIITYQLVKNKSRFLTNADIGVSKGILDVFSVNLFFRRPFQTEFKGGKNELYCYNTGGEYSNSKVEFKLEKDKHYMICFISKNRFGTSGIQIVSEADFSINKYKDLGYCVVPEDF